MSNNATGGFWHTVPGVLTGIAAIITAITGVVLAIQAINPERAEDPVTTNSIAMEIDEQVSAEANEATTAQDAVSKAVTPNQTGLGTVEIQLSEVDDTMTVWVNNEIAQEVRFGEVKDWVQINDLLRPGPNAIRYEVYNGDYGGCSGVLKLRSNGTELPEFTRRVDVPMESAPANGICGTRTLTLNM